MPIGSGIDAQIGIAEQVAYGTYLAPTKFFAFNSSDLQPNIVELTASPIGLGRFYRTGFVRYREVGGSGSIEMPLANKGMGLWFKHMLGAVASAQVGATAEYTHTFTPGANALLGSYLTVQAGVPSTDGTVRPFTFTGCKVTQWTINAGLNEIATLSVTVDAGDADTGQSLAAVSIPTGLEFYSFLEGSITIGGSAAGIIKGVSITGNNPMKTDRIGFGGTKYEPISNDLMDVTGEFTSEFENLTAYNAWVAGTEVANLVVTFTGSTIPTTPNPFKLVITIPSLKYTGTAPSVGGPDVVEQNKPFRALYNGTNPVITLAYHTNDVTP